MSKRIGILLLIVALVVFTAFPAFAHDRDRDGSNCDGDDCKLERAGHGPVWDDTDIVEQVLNNQVT